MILSGSLHSLITNAMPARRGPVHVDVHVRPMLRPFENAFTIEAIAISRSGFGRALVVVDEQSIAVGQTNKSAFLLQLEKTLFRCADRALTEHLVDHETQQGWPPRDCLHDRVDGAEELS